MPTDTLNDTSIEAIIETFEVPVCPMCHSTGLLIYNSLEDKIFGVPGVWKIKRCHNARCRTLWLSPRPTEKDLHKAYTHYYTHESSRTSEWDIPAVISTSKKRQVFQWLKKGYLSAFWKYESANPLQKIFGGMLFLVPFLKERIRFGIREITFKAHGKLLDVSCGDGNFLLQMRDLGWNCVGTEVDPKATEKARRQGLIVHEGFLKPLNLPSEDFDYIVINHVLEHVLDPQDVLKECHRILAPNGEIRLLIPNPESLGHKIFGRSWRGLEPPRHLTLYTVESLERLLRSQGFNVKLKTLSQGFRFFWSEGLSVEKKTGLPNRKLSFLQAYLLWFVEFFLIKMGLNCGEEILIKAKKFS